MTDKLQGKKVKLNGCSGPRAAVKLVADAMQSFKDNAD